MYQFLLFLHIIASFGLISLWVFDVIQRFTSASSADSERKKSYVAFQVTGMITVLGTGLYMMQERWRGQAWLIVAVLILLSTIVVSRIPVLIEKWERSRGIENVNIPDAMKIEALYKIVAAIVIIYLMVYKPN